MIDYGVAALTFPGETECGDGYVVRVRASNILVAAVDGVGHGLEAAEARTVAVDTLAASGLESVVQLVRNCHENLRDTRGVAMSIASLNPESETMTWLGVGNVLGLVMHADPEADPPRRFLLLRGGVVGRNLPPLFPATFPIGPGDTLIFATDGVSTAFTDDLLACDSPQQMAEEILNSYAFHTDDALVLVVRYLGGSGES